MTRNNLPAHNPKTDNASTPDHDDCELMTVQVTTTFCVPRRLGARVSEDGSCVVLPDSTRLIPVEPIFNRDAPGQTPGQREYGDLSGKELQEAYGISASEVLSSAVSVTEEG